MAAAAPPKRWSGAFSGSTQRSAAAEVAAPGTHTSSPYYNPGPGAPSANSADKYHRTIFLDALRSRQPGQWTDNRLEQSQHMVGAVYVALKVIADQAAGARLNCFKLKKDAKQFDDRDSREPLPYGHPLSQLMRQPNEKETGSMLRRKMVNQLGLTGSSLLWAVPSQAGPPVDLWSIPTATTQAVPRSAQYPDGAYRFTPYLAYGPWAYFPGLGNVGGVVVPSDEIIRTDFPHPLAQYDAYSPLTACNLQLDTLEAIDKSRWHGMKQSINPSGVVEVSPEVAFPDQDELDRLKLAFAERMGGVENTGRLAVMSPGLTLKPWSHAPADMGWENSWSQLVDFVLSVFGVTKSLAFMTTEASYASLYASLKQFNLFSLKPLLQLIADSINVQLVWPFYGPDHFIELLPESIDDESLKTDQLAQETTARTITVNEHRISNNREPVPWGDVRIGEDQQAQQGAFGKPGGGGKPDDEQEYYDAESPPDESPPEAEVERPDHGQGEGSLPGKGASKSMHKSGGREDEWSWLDDARDEHHEGDNA